jgi:hypothetical protein
VTGLAFLLGLGIEQGGQPPAHLGCAFGVRIGDAVVHGGLHPIEARPESYLPSRVAPARDEFRATCWHREFDPALLD